MGPNAYQKPENRGGLERPNDVVFSNDGKTMYIVDYGEVFTDFDNALAVLHRAQVRRDLDGHQDRRVVEGITSTHVGWPGKPGHPSLSWLESDRRRH